MIPDSRDIVFARGFLTASATLEIEMAKKAKKATKAKAAPKKAKKKK
ncbi:MAG: hypothetical protein ACK4X1_14340 [Terricaulis sp.]